MFGLFKSVRRLGGEATCDKSALRVDSLLLLIRPSAFFSPHCRLCVTDKINATFSDPSDVQIMFISINLGDSLTSRSLSFQAGAVIAPQALS